MFITLAIVAGLGFRNRHDIQLSLVFLVAMRPTGYFRRYKEHKGLQSRTEKYLVSFLKYECLSNQEPYFDQGAVTFAILNPLRVVRNWNDFHYMRLTIVCSILCS